MPVSKAMTSIGVSLAGFVAGWLLGDAIKLKPNAPKTSVAPSAPPAAQPLALQQSIRVECAGRILEGVVASIYIEEGQAVIRVSDHSCDPLDEGLWTWEDEGASAGN